MSVTCFFSLLFIVVKYEQVKQQKVAHNSHCAKLKMITMKMGPEKRYNSSCMLGMVGFYHGLRTHDG